MMLLVDLVVGLAQDGVVVLEGELVAGRELYVAHAAAEAVDMVDVVVRAHHKVVLAESLATLETPPIEQPTKQTEK
jgi:hypothetical protein